MFRINYVKSISLIIAGDLLKLNVAEIKCGRSCFLGQLMVWGYQRLPVTKDQADCRNVLRIRTGRVFQGKLGFLKRASSWVVGRFHEGEGKYHFTRKLALWRKLNLDQYMTIFCRR